MTVRLICADGKMTLALRFALMINYTIWSRGRELGSTTLAFAHCFPNSRAGWFFPNNVGASLMPVITGTRDAWLALMVAGKRGELEGLSGAELAKTTHYADVAAAAAHEDALQLELRGPDGRVIPTEEIHVRDTEVFIPEIHGDDPAEKEVPLDDLSRKDREMLREFQEEMEELIRDKPDEPPPWEPPCEMGRYQIFVTLFNEWDVP